MENPLVTACLAGWNGLEKGEGRRISVSNHLIWRIIKINRDPPVSDVITEACNSDLSVSESSDCCWVSGRKPWYECMLLFEYDVSPTGSCFEQFFPASGTILKIRKPLGSEAWLVELSYQGQALEG